MVWSIDMVLVGTKLKRGSIGVLVTVGQLVVGITDVELPV